MKPTEQVRALKTRMSKFIWMESLAIKNNDPRSIGHGVNRQDASNDLLRLAEIWNDMTVAFPLCEKK